jgi:hypothetical protein
MNPLEKFLSEFDTIVPTQQRLLEMDEAMKATPMRWWGTHKNNITYWTQCQTLMSTQFSAQEGSCEA